MGPCKTTESLPTGAPIALSYPHFYQADQSFRDAVIGMKPEKEKHQMFADIHPKFGFPLALAFCLCGIELAPLAWRFASAASNWPHWPGVLPLRHQIGPTGLAFCLCGIELAPLAWRFASAASNWPHWPGVLPLRHQIGPTGLYFASAASFWPVWPHLHC